MLFVTRTAQYDDVCVYMCAKVGCVSRCGGDVRGRASLCRAQLQVNQLEACAHSHRYLDSAEHTAITLAPPRCLIHTFVCQRHLSCCHADIVDPEAHPEVCTYVFVAEICAHVLLVLERSTLLEDPENTTPGKR